MTGAQRVTPGDVAAVVRRYWVQQARTEPMLLLRARPEWGGPEELDVEGVVARVGVAATPLAVRDLLSGEDRPERLVVLTDLDDAALGDDLLSQAVRQRVNAVDLWDTVRAAFGVSATAFVDGSLAREGSVVAHALLERVPAGGWAPPPSGVLTREHAFRCLVEETVGLSPRQLDAAGLLEWSLDPVQTLALHDLPEGLRTRLVGWLLQHTGAETRPVLDLAVAGHGADAVPLGLVAGVLWSAAGAGRAQGWLEQMLGRPLRPGEAGRWSELSHGWVERRLVADPARALTVLHRAEELMGEVHAAELVGGSRLLPGGLTARTRAVAQAAAAAVTSPSARARAAVETAYAELGRHELATLPGKDVEAVGMAVRLVRWLATDPAAPGHAQEALAWQVAEGGWVDRARQVVANGADDAVVAEHLAALHAAVGVRRGALDAAAAVLVAAAVAADQPFGSLVPVEEALSRLVVPLAADRPVLMLVLDGMSAAVATEVVASAVAEGWVEQVREGGAAREVLMAALPTVTEVSRTSLLSGRLQQGGQREEREGVRSVLGSSAWVFHLRDLEARPGQDLPDEVRESVQDTSVGVVVGVLNAVDDSLSGGDPGRTRWTVDAVRHLRPLLERARAAGRVVVLTSDHGHVVDEATEGEVRFVRAGGGARWRPADGVVGEGEVRLTGRRVVLGGGDVVAAVAERLRYKQRAEGYHGGAALAELAIPFVVLGRRGDNVAGWSPAPALEPAWWARPAVAGLGAGGPDAPTLFE